DINCKKKGKDVEAKEGEAASLPCSFSDPTKYNKLEVTWQREVGENAVVIHAENPMGKSEESQDRLFSGRTSIPSSWNQTGDTTLTIRQAQEEDSGNYTCIIRGGGRPAYCAFLLLKVNSGSFQLYGGHHSVWIPFLLLVLMQVPT
ncbi:hypothetical protein scyTo_0022437, partial [Scyliorhinus torazame]|nr:hypothetical protein [Scyliorhinus torazame]